METPSPELLAFESPCGHTHDSDSRYCDVCGTKLPVRCARCKTVNRPQASFCRRCGLDLAESPADGRTQRNRDVLESSGDGAIPPGVSAVTPPSADAGATKSDADMSASRFLPRLFSVLRHKDAAHAEQRTLGEPPAPITTDEDRLSEVNDPSEAARLRAFVDFDRRHAARRRERRRQMQLSLLMAVIVAFVIATLMIGALSLLGGQTVSRPTAPSGVSSLLRPCCRHPPVSQAQQRPPLGPWLAS
jgi:hypothetical protein